jgi:hypothetical protein
MNQGKMGWQVSQNRPGTHDVAKATTLGLACLVIIRNSINLSV